MDDQKAEQQINDNKAIAENLSSCLGGRVGKISVKCFEITWEDGKGVDVNVVDRERFFVSLNWPIINHSYFYPEDTHPRSISVSKSRPITDLAKEITRRLLPDYDKRWQACVDLANKQFADRDRRQNLVNELAHLVSPYSVSEQERQGGYVNCCNHNLARLEVGEEGNTVSIKTYHMPVEVAKQVLALIVKLNPNK